MLLPNSDVDDVEDAESFFCRGDGDGSCSEGSLHRLPEVRKGVTQGILFITIA